jgi:hypothetical protein
MSGYARFHRSLIGHPAFRNDAEAMAFAYLVLRASWRPVRVRYKGKALNLNRGQLAMSVRDLAEAMDRDKGWVERLLKRLKSETMVETVTETGVMVITICNYEKYQAANDGSETPHETPGETHARQTRDTEQRREEGKKEEGEANASPRAKRAGGQGTRLPDDWQPSRFSDGTVAREVIDRRGVEWARRVNESFRNHWRSANGPTARKRDWQAAWANWVIEQDNRDGQRNGTHGMAGNRGGGPQPARIMSAGAGFLSGPGGGSPH